MRSIVRHFRQSLSWKLSLGILLMAIPIFILALGILFCQSRNYIKNEATKHATSMLNTTMQGFLRNMDMAKTAADINSWEVTAHLDPDSLLNISRYVVAFNPHVDGCSVSTQPDVFPQYGRYFSAYTVREADTIVTVIEKKYEYFDKIWYSKPRGTSHPCWVVYYDESDSLAVTIDGMVASYCKPLYDADNRFVAVITTDISLLRLSKTITRETPYQDSYFMMTGEEGRFYLHPDTTRLFTKTIFSDADPEKNSDIISLGYEMTTGQQGTMSVNIDGKACLVSYQPVPGTDWSLALVCPERSILIGYNRLTLILLPLCIIGMLLILLFSIFTVAHAIKPLNKLTSKIQRITEGHYDERISTSPYTDIVGRLQNTFATMQQSLSLHVSDIRQMNAEAIRRNEELIRTSHLAEIANHQKTLFIQNVSHQIRTPLNIIMGFSQVLHDTKSSMFNVQSSMSPEELNSITSMIRHNARILNRMVLMLFDCSKLSNLQSFNSSILQFYNKDDTVFCNDIARECILHSKEHFPDIPIRFVTELADDFSIHTSHLFLMRSIRELLYNACKYSDGHNVSILVSEAGSKLRFIVEDTGPGIAEEDISRLFEMFVKVNDLSEGLGIGLPLSRRHILNLGGDLFLDTTYHLGCRLIIEIPKISR